VREKIWNLKVEPGSVVSRSISNFLPDHLTTTAQGVRHGEDCLEEGRRRGRGEGSKGTWDCGHCVVRMQRHVRLWRCWLFVWLFGVIDDDGDVRGAEEIRRFPVRGDYAGSVLRFYAPTYICIYLYCRRSRYCSDPPERSMRIRPP
jgi:hypothetical protein